MVHYLSHLIIQWNEDNIQIDKTCFNCIALKIQEHLKSSANFRTTKTMPYPAPRDILINLMRGSREFIKNAAVFRPHAQADDRN